MNYIVPQGRLRLGSPQDHSILTKFIVEAYREMFPEQSDFSHLKTTVAQHLSKQTPLFWFERETTIACLWLGDAIDQISGTRYAYIFLVYVQPSHRRQGIGKYLLQIAENYAQERGDKLIGLQVFLKNTSALALYHKLGYQSNSSLMLKSL